MTHKTGRPNHQLPALLRVALPNAPFARPGPPASSPRSVGANQVAARSCGLRGFPSQATPSLLAFAPLPSNSSAWTNSLEGAGRAEPVNQSLTLQRDLAKEGSGSQRRGCGVSTRHPPQVGSRPRASRQGA